MGEAVGRLYVVTPVFNDWESFEKLIEDLESVAEDLDREIVVLAVDDGSRKRSTAFKALSDRLRIDVVVLTHNQGHQRAICIGLVALSDYPPGPCVVMDADGEDLPCHIPRLIDRLNESNADAVFAKRQKRSESVRFVLFWHLFRLLFRCATGSDLRSGNFSVLSANASRLITTAPGLWNHYAACLHRLRLHIEYVGLDRGSRYSGSSKMNMVSLVTHGLSAVAVYAELVATRVLLSVTALAAVAAGGLGTILGVRLMTDLAIPGWATFSAGLVIVFITQLITLSAVACLLVLGQRSNRQFIPKLDAVGFIHRIDEHAG